MFDSEFEWGTDIEMFYLNSTLNFGIPSIGIGIWKYWYSS